MAETALLSHTDILDDSFAVLSSPESLRRQSPIAPHITDQEADPEGYENQNDTDSGTEDGYGIHDAILKPAQSTRTSISSFPASVIHNNSYLDRDNFGPRTPSKSHSIRSYQNERAKSPVSKRYSPGLAHINGFRNPSSVLEMQMCESEYGDTDDVTPNHRRKNSQLSHYSYRSSNSLRSSPTKRSSRTNTPHRQANSGSKLKKEFPLVLLHCTLLPPAVTSYGPLVTDEVLEAVLPDGYRKRWRTLQDKITKNSEVKQRGVLIPHPREDYDLLEERLLESLELQRPKIRQHHYLGGNDNDSGFESASSYTDSTSSGDEEDEEPAKLHQKCPDCGKHVTLLDPEHERKWEVKVYAANGLMRGGAWAAAWSEMEKVDVEVGVWMPEEVRREVESRLAALQQKQDEFDAREAEMADDQVQTPSQRKISGERTRIGEHYDERMKEIYGGTSTQGRRQEEIDGLDDMRLSRNTSVPSTPGDTDVKDFAHIPTYQHVASSQTVEPGLLDLIQRRMQLLFQDQRNIAIVLLSVLVLFFAISSAPKQGTTSASVPVATSRNPVSVSTLVAEVSSLQSQEMFTTTSEMQQLSTNVNTDAASLTSGSPTSMETQSGSASSQAAEEDKNDKVASSTPDLSAESNETEPATSTATERESVKAEAASKDDEVASVATSFPSSSETISTSEPSAEQNGMMEGITPSEAEEVLENVIESQVEEDME